MNNEERKIKKSAYSKKYQLIKNGKLVCTPIVNGSMIYECIECHKKIKNDLISAYETNFKCKKCNALDNLRNNENKKERKIKNSAYSKVNYYKNHKNLEYEIKNGKITYLCLQCGKIIEEPIVVASSKNFVCEKCLKINAKINEQAKEDIEVCQQINKQYEDTLLDYDLENEETTLLDNSCDNSCIECNKCEKEKIYLEDYWNIKSPEEMTLFEKLRNFFFKEKLEEVIIKADDIRKTAFDGENLIITYVKNK